MNDNPRAQLRKVLEAKGLEAYAPLARAAGISAREAMNAIAGAPISAAAHLRLCAVVKLNPCPHLPYEAPAPADFDYPLFAMGFRLRRGLNKHSDRVAAAVIGVSASTVCRIERGDAMFIGVVLRACSYIGVNPFGYFVPAARKGSPSQKFHVRRAETREAAAS